MKNKLALVAAGLFLSGTVAMAATFPSGTSFTVQASVPRSSGIGITVNSVDAATSKIFTPVATTTLDFGTLSFVSGPNIYLPDHFFVLDIAPLAGGAGLPDTTFTYTEGSKPVGQVNGLGTKSSITYAKEVFTTSSTPPAETILTSEGPQVMKNVSAKHIPSTDVPGGWLRAYVGVCSGNPATDPTGCAPFTNADQAGAYSGQLVVTSTVV